MIMITHVGGPGEKGQKCCLAWIHTSGLFLSHEYSITTSITITTVVPYLDSGSAVTGEKKKNLYSFCFRPKIRNFSRKVRMYIHSTVVIREEEEVPRDRRRSTVKVRLRIGAIIIKCKVVLVDYRVLYIFVEMGLRNIVSCMSI